jgi:hypothetical protein
MDYTTLSIRIPKDFDYKINILMAEFKRDQVRKTKADLVVELAQEGYSHNRNQNEQHKENKT